MNVEWYALRCASGGGGQRTEEPLGYLWNSAAAARMGRLLRCAYQTWRPKWALEHEADNSAWDLGLSRPWH